MGRDKGKAKKANPKRRGGAPPHESALAEIPPARPDNDYGRLVSDLSALLEQARVGAARSVNAILTATYWEIGRRIVEHEQAGKARAGYGEELLARLSVDLTARYGRGFCRPGLQRMRSVYVGWEICSTPSSKLEASP